MTRFSSYEACIVLCFQAPTTDIDEVDSDDLYYENEIQQIQAARNFEGMETMKFKLSVLLLPSNRRLMAVFRKLPKSDQSWLLKSGTRAAAVPITQNSTRGRSMPLKYIVRNLTSCYHKSTS